MQTNKIQTWNVQSYNFNVKPKIPFSAKKARTKEEAQKDKKNGTWVIDYYSLGFWWIRSL